MKQLLHSNKCKQFESNLISAIYQLQHFARSRQFLTGLNPHDLAERFSRTPTNMSTNLQRSILLNGRVTSRGLLGTQHQCAASTGHTQLFHVWETSPMFCGSCIRNRQDIVCFIIRACS